MRDRLPSSTFGLAWKGLATGLLLGLVLFPAVATFSTLPIRLTSSAAAVLFATLTATATALVVGTVALTRVAGLAGALASFATAVAMLRHARETYSLNLNGWRFALLCGLVALPIFVLARVPAKYGPVKKWLAVALSAAVLASLLAAGTYLASDYHRWILVRHVETLGTPLHRLLSGPWPMPQDSGASTRQSRPTPSDPDSPRNPATAPDVAFVLIDTLRADALSPWGRSDRRLHHLEQLVADSVVFSDVLANSSWTRPSVASFFTGLQQEEHGARDRGEALAPGFTTLAERFRAMGYRTLAIVANSGAVGRGTGLEQGFDEFLEPEAEPYPRAEQVTDAVESLLAKESVDWPLFVYVHYLDPHTPYLSGSLPTSYAPAAARPAYEAELRYLDESMGRLRELLQRRGRPPAWLFLTSDHGEEFGEHGEGAHGHTLYQELVRLPALLSRPGVAPARIAEPLEARDFFDLLPRLDSDAFDLQQWAADRKRHLRYSSVYFTNPGMAQRWRKFVNSRRIDFGDSTMIWSAYGPTRELYDRNSDPEELRNLAGESAEELDLLESELRAAIPPWAPSLPAARSEEALRQLRALGYLN